MPRLFVPGNEQPLLERGRSPIGTDGLGWLTPGRTKERIWPGHSHYPEYGAIYCRGPWRPCSTPFEPLLPGGQWA